MIRHAIRIALVIIAFGAAAAIAIGDIAHRAAARRLREVILAELQPVVLRNCTLRRFGSANDGGYLMCENLLGNVTSAYSYGIGPTDDWGCDVSQRYGLTVHQYDCFSPPLAGCPSGRSSFHDE